MTFNLIEYNHSYYLKNIKKRKADSKKNYDENRDRIKEYYIAYWIKNKVKMLEQRRLNK